MYSELIVMVFTGREDLDNAWRLLERSKGGNIFRLIDVILVRRDRLGKSTFQVRRRESDRLNNSNNRLAVDFADAIFGISRAEGRCQLADAGMKPFF